MKKRGPARSLALVGAFLVLLVSSVVVEADHIPISPEAEALVSTSLFSGPFGGYEAEGTRRWATDTITWRVHPSAVGRRLDASADFAVSGWASLLPVGVTLIETLPADEPAHITFVYGAIAGCAAVVPTAEADRVFVVARTGRSGCDGPRIMLHEMGHAMGQGHSAKAIMSPSCLGCPSIRTGERGADYIRRPGVLLPGQAEGFAWVYAHPPGAVP